MEIKEVSFPRAEEKRSHCHVFMKKPQDPTPTGWKYLFYADDCVVSNINPFAQTEYLDEPSNFFICSPPIIKIRWVVYPYSINYDNVYNFFSKEDEYGCKCGPYELCFFSHTKKPMMEKQTVMAYGHIGCILIRDMFDILQEVFQVETIHEVFKAFEEKKLDYNWRNHFSCQRWEFFFECKSNKDYGPLGYCLCVDDDWFYDKEID